MDRFTLDVRKLRHPLADIVPLGIELLALGGGVEDAEVRLGVDARGGAEAPPAVVGREVAVDELLHEEAFPEPPVDEEVFGQEGGRRHARAVVHVPRVQELAHRGVDEGVARVAGAPGAEGGVVVFPGYVGVFGFEGFVHAGENGDVRRGLGGCGEGVLPDEWPVDQHVFVKVSPCYF